jgi:signal peptidase I
MNQPRVIQTPSHAEVSMSDRKIQKTRKIFKISSVVLAVILFVFSFVSFVLEPIQVQGISMEPTFHTGNIVLVWRFPQTWAKITNGQYIPHRGNLVVIKKTPISGEDLIKRVVGLPGERVNIDNNAVTVYNSAQPNGFNPDGAPYGKILVPTSGTFNTVMPSGQLFVLGDNRTVGASIDSRSSLGNIPSSELVGKVILKIYPFSQIKIF